MFHRSRHLNDRVAKMTPLIRHGLASNTQKLVLIGQQYKSSHDFEAVYIKQLSRYVSLLSVMLLNWLLIYAFVIVSSNMMYNS